MASEDVNRSKAMCPFLGILDEAGTPAPCVDYPSFENMCFVGDTPDAIMLTDQATFCLSSGHRHCPRLSNPDGDRPVGANSPKGEGFGDVNHSDPVLHAISEMEDALNARHLSRAKRRRRWGWIGAAAIIASSLLCSGMFAAYIGWRLVYSDPADLQQTGTVTTLALPATAAAPPVYLIVTATSDAPALPKSSSAAPSTSGNSTSGRFPPAVTATATPGVQNINGVENAPQSGSQIQATPTILTVSPALPPGNIILQIPTRRPTPIMDLAITVPTAPIATALPPPTPTPPL